MVRDAANAVLSHVIDVRHFATITQDMHLTFLAYYWLDHFEGILKKDVHEAIWDSHFK